MRVHTYACAYTYTYTCAHDSHYIYQCAIFATLWSGGGRFFSWFFRWLVDWLVGSWVEDPADLRRDVWRIYYVDAVSISMYMYIQCQRIGIYNIYRWTVYPISKIGYCWCCCYYYCRCCCACSCCWCLVILLYIPLYSPRHIHSSLALFFCLSPSPSSSLSVRLFSSSFPLSSIRDAWVFLSLAQRKCLFLIDSGLLYMPVLFRRQKATLPASGAKLEGEAWARSFLREKIE